MSKTYFGITRSKGLKTIVGVVANKSLPGTSYATPEEAKEILAIIRPAATVSLRDALSDGTYPNPIVVWRNRAAARAAIGQLTGSPYFDYSVCEFGEKVRTVKPVLGWRILIDGVPSAFNTKDDSMDDEFPRVQVNHAHLFSGDPDANQLFATRADGRALMEQEKLREIGGYSLVPVYA